MKKALIAAAVASVFLFSSVASAASCGTSYKFKAYVKNANGTYSLAITTTSASYLIGQIAANPSYSGYVKGQDLVCDGYDFWRFKNGTWSPAR